MKAIGLKAWSAWGFLLRHGRVDNAGKCRCIQAHFRWPETVTFRSAVQQMILQEYIEAIKETQHQMAGLEEQIRQALAQ